MRISVTTRSGSCWAQAATSSSPVDETETTLNLAVQNQGDALVRPDMWVELYAEDGSAIGRIEGQKSRLYPGTSITQRIKLGNLDTGAYRALVIMDAGEEDVFGAEFTLNID